MYNCLLPLSQAVIKKKYGQDATNVGDEGGFAPNIQVNLHFPKYALHFNEISLVILIRTLPSW